MLFSGRIAEDFKLLTGTFVHVGVLRVEAIAAASPVIQDALVTGQDRPFVGILAWPALEACRRMIGDMTATPERVAAHPLIRDHVRDRLRAHNREFTGSSSMRVARAILIAEPASIDSGELTDKGYINAAAAAEFRRELAACSDQGATINMAFFQALLAQLETDTMGAETALKRMTMRWPSPIKATIVATSPSSIASAAKSC